MLFRDDTPPFWVIFLVVMIIVVGLLLVFAVSGPLTLYGEPYQ